MKREIYSLKMLVLERKKDLKSSKLHLKKLEKEEHIKPKVNRRKEIIKK